MASEDYIHPIIQAMQFAQQRADALKQAVIEQQNKLTQQQLQQDQFKEAQQQHKDEMAQKNAQLAIEQAKAKADLQTHDLNVQNFLKDFFAGGGQPTAIQPSQNFIPTVLKPTQQPDLSVGGIPVSADTVKQYQDLPEAQFNREYRQKVALAGGTAGATAAAQEPFKIADDKRSADEKMAGLKFEADAKERLANLDNASREKIANINGGWREQLGIINAQTRLAAAQNGLDPGDVSNLVNDVYVTANQDVNNVQAKLREPLTKSVPSGWTPIGKDKTTFDGIGSVLDLINKSRQLSAEGSSPMGRIAAATGIGALGEAGNTAKELNGLLGNISRVLGGEKGVLTQSDINRAKDLMYSPTATLKQNLQKADDLQEFFQTKLKPTLNKYPPDQLEKIFAARGIDPSSLKIKSTTVPDWLKVAPKSNAKGTPIDVDKSIELGHPVYGR